MSTTRRICAIAALAGTFASCAIANVTINTWSDANHFHHKRVGIPDQDQKRVGLPNSGSCYCVPTSHMNMLMYIANHGYPAVVPGPGDYSGYDTYYAVTGLLEDLGGWAGISPGGSDPDDPDCVGDPGGDGECATLPCGGSIENVYNAILDHGWLGSAEDDLVWTARFIDLEAPTTNFANLAKLGYQGNLVAFCYGRYKPVGGTSQGDTIYRRTSGHCVTMAEAFADGATQLLSSRDPGDDGDIFGPSPYASKQYTVTSETLYVTTDTGILLSWTQKTLSGLDEPHNDGVKRLVDGYIAVKPKSGVFWKDFEVIKELPLAPGFGGVGDPSPFPIPNAPILDLVDDENLVGWYALRGSGGSAPQQLVRIDPVEGSTTILVNTDATRLALGRMGELFTIGGGAVVRKYDLTGVLKKSVVLPFQPKAIAYDDALDRVLVAMPFSSGFGGILSDMPRSLGSPRDPIVSYTIPTNIPLGGAVRMSVNPADGVVWFASSSDTKARGLLRPSTPNGTMIPVQTIGEFSALSDIEFDDGGSAYVVSGGTAKVFVKSSAGQWTPGDSSAFAGLNVGTTLRIARSRTNFDPAQHDTDAWRDLPFEQLEPIGTRVPDCIGDLDGNWTVDAADLALLLGGWGGGGLSDLDGSGTTDAADLAILLGAWGTCPAQG
ncbi:MAG: hypothetical protein U0572_14765 [Phycisphaerales bacterium]